MTITGQQYSRESHRALLLTLLALGALGLLACGGGDDDETTTEVGLSPEQRIEQEIEQVGNEWAALFAGGERFCELMTQPACERNTCKSVAGPIENCTPPSSTYRKSFEDATVEDIGITGRIAGARFSNGETVQLEKVKHVPDPLAEDGDRAGWLIDKVGGNAGDVGLITEVGNAWARLFAEDNSAACEFMYGQPLCEEYFGRVGEPPEVGRPSEFQESFANATVERVAVKDAQQIRVKDGTRIELHKAVGEFSNGELVEFIEETDKRQPLFGQLGAWFVNDAAGKSCGSFGRYRFAVVEGDISCRVARGVMDGFVYQRLPGAWICTGPDSYVECSNEAGETIRASCCGASPRWIKREPSTTRPGPPGTP